MIRFLVIFLILFSTTVWAEEHFRLESYSATYSVKYRGFKLGLVNLSLTPAENDTYMYETRVKPGMLARLVVSKQAFERTTVTIDGKGVRPLNWISEDGKKSTEDDGILSFDWKARKVSGTVEDEPVSLRAKKGLQDRLSMQVAVLVAMLRDEPPGTITMIDGRKIKTYSYVRKGEQQISTDAGTYDTILWESTRPGSSRFKRIYHAPELGYIPVRFEHFKKGKLNTVMELVSVTPKEGALLHWVD